MFIVIIKYFNVILFEGVNSGWKCYINNIFEFEHFSTECLNWYEFFVKDFNSSCSWARLNKKIKIENGIFSKFFNCFVFFLEFLN